MSRPINQLLRHRWQLVGTGIFVTISLALTLMVAGTLSRAQGGDTIEVTGVFSDATGLRTGDDVRMAGVRIGRVVRTELGDGEDRGRAVVTMAITAEQGLHDDVRLAIDYLNLMGQRYVAISRPTATAGAGPLLDGARIGIERTRPALDLTAMFNAFRPVFELLQPGDINVLASNIVQLLQGQGPTITHLMEQTAELTTDLVDRDEVFAEVVDNLNLVLATTNEHRPQIEQLLEGFGSLAEGLAADRDRIGESLDALTSLATSADRLIDGVDPHVRGGVPLAADFLAYLSSRSDLLADTAEALHTQLAVYLRTLSYGSYLNVYVCTNVMVIDGVPLEVPFGPGTTHSERCR
jgi:phospholipid/cholesterol/gamma-HCH transport system substrate-binding protein